MFGDGRWGSGVTSAYSLHSPERLSFFVVFPFSRKSQVLYAFVSLWLDAKLGCFLSQAEKPPVSFPSKSRWHGGTRGVVEGVSWSLQWNLHCVAVFRNHRRSLAHSHHTCYKPTEHTSIRTPRGWRPLELPILIASVTFGEDNNTFKEEWSMPRGKCFLYLKHRQKTSLMPLNKQIPGHGMNSFNQ